jgi:hypothetical protein
MTIRAIAVLAAAACLSTTPAFADNPDSSGTSATTVPACEAKAAKHVYPHPHKGLIVKRSVKADTACTVAQPKKFDTSI